MTGYGWMYRLGFTPWERYATSAAGSISALLEREEAGRTRPPGRALDLGCGRGLHSVMLAARGWEVVGVDAVPAAIRSATRVEGVSYAVADVTNLRTEALGTFDLFLDVGCFQGLDVEQRLAEGRGVTELAAPGATLLMLAFGRSWARPLVGGVDRADVEDSFPRWTVLSVEPAPTAGLGWPMNRTRPKWYRLRLSGDDNEP